jgi:TonB family protein
MRVAEQRLPISASPRRIPSSVRLSPCVLNEFRNCLGTRRPELEASIDVTGLLFGTTEQELVGVEKFKPFPPADLAENGSPKPGYLDAAFERLLAEARADAELASLQLIGWCCVAATGDIAPLIDSDIESYNRRFRRATDLVLVLKPQQHTGMSIELYSRSSLKTSISRQDFRSGTLLLDASAGISEPIDVTMRAKVDDDYYFRVFQVLDSLDRAERKKSWKRIALFVKRAPLSLTSKWPRSGVRGKVNSASPEPSQPSVPPMTTARSILKLDPSESAVNGLPVQPMSRPTTLKSLPLEDWAKPQMPVRATAGHTKLRRVTVVFLLGAAVVFAWFYPRVRSALLPGNAPDRAVVANPPLGLQVERREHRLLLTWNTRSSVVQSATEAIVQVDDGSQLRTTRLNPSEVANGSFVYTPSSNFVMFRVDVLNNKGSTISESLGVGDGSNSARIIPNPPSGALQRAPVPKTGGAYAKSGTWSPRSGAQLAKAEEPSNSRLGPAKSHASANVDRRSAGQSPSRVVDSHSKEPIRRRASENSPPVQSPKISMQPAVVKNSVAGPASRYAPARPLKQVMPNTRTLASALLHTSTDIEVEVRIDDEGRVAEAHVLNDASNENKVLTNAALAAAREWIFEPAKVNGKNVPSDHAIAFHFRPQVGQR